MEFWAAKFAGNVERDKGALEALRVAGWRTALVWECGLRPAAVQQTCHDLIDWIRSDRLDTYESPIMREFHLRPARNLANDAPKSLSRDAQQHSNTRKPKEQDLEGD